MTEGHIVDVRSVPIASVSCGVTAPGKGVSFGGSERLTFKKYAVRTDLAQRTGGKRFAVNVSRLGDVGPKAIVVHPGNRSDVSARGVVNRWIGFVRPIGIPLKLVTVDLDVKRFL